MRRRIVGAGLGLAAAVAAAALTARPVSAVVKAGDQEASVDVGAAIPTLQYDLTAVGGKTETMAGGGVDFGGQYLYHLTPALGLGGEYNYASYADATRGITGATVTSSYKTWSLEAVARYVFMPEARVNPYLMAGLGMGSVSAKATTTLQPGYVWTDTLTSTPATRTNLDGSSTGAAFSLGAGADADLTDSLFAGPTSAGGTPARRRPTPTARTRGSRTRSPAEAASPSPESSAGSSGDEASPILAPPSAFPGAGGGVARPQ